MELKYNLNKIVPERDEIEIIIEGDCNDGDYNTTIDTFNINKLEDQDFLKALYGLDAMRYPREDISKQLMEELEIDEEEASEIEDLIENTFDIPRDDWGVCHTITSVSAIAHMKDGSKYNIKIKEK